MKNCKYCQAELADNGSFCPVCGKNNDEELEQLLTEAEIVPEEQPAFDEIPDMEKPKATPAKIATAVVAVILLVAILFGLLAGSLGIVAKPQESVAESTAAAETVEETLPPATIPADGNPDDETCKGTYTASDEEVIANADTVVATMGEYQLTNAELQVYYWLEIQAFISNYGSYAYYYGLDYTQPMDTQVCYLSDKMGSWQQFFLASALQTWQNYQSMYAEATVNGFELSQEDLDELANMEQSLEEQAVQRGFENGKAMLEYNVGAGAEIEDYIKFNEVYYKGYQYYSQLCDAIEITDQEVEEYFTANEATFADQGITKEDKYVDVRHILIMPESTTAEDGTSTITDEAWAASEEEAKKILSIWETGGEEEDRQKYGWQAEAKTEDFFAELANTFTHDGNDANYDGIPDGGLYTNVYKGQMVEPFENWCFDENRIIGDTGLVQTTYGWHVMYYAGSEPVWISESESALLGEKITAMINEINAKHPIEVDYSSILLGYVDMTA